MVAMEPVWRFLHNLEGFEFAAFWIAFVVAVGLVGFFLDYVMQRQGFGPFFNSLFVLAAIYFGLYLRFNYLQPNRLQIHLYDPYLSLVAVCSVLVPMLVVMAFVRNKLS